MLRNSLDINERKSERDIERERESPGGRKREKKRKRVREREGGGERERTSRWCIAPKFIDVFYHNPLVLQSAILHRWRVGPINATKCPDNSAYINIFSIP